MEKIIKTISKEIRIKSKSGNYSLVAVLEDNEINSYLTDLPFEYVSGLLEVSDEELEESFEMIREMKKTLKELKNNV